MCMHQLVVLVVKEIHLKYLKILKEIYLILISSDALITNVEKSKIYDIILFSLFTKISWQVLLYIYFIYLSLLN